MVQQKILLPVYVLLNCLQRKTKIQVKKFLSAVTKFYSADCISTQKRDIQFGPKAKRIQWVVCRAMLYVQQKAGKTYNFIKALLGRTGQED